MYDENWNLLQNTTLSRMIFQEKDCDVFKYIKWKENWLYSIKCRLTNAQYLLKTTEMEIKKMQRQNDDL